jgi:L-histidine N-alpha-methyltransferase
MDFIPNKPNPEPTVEQPRTVVYDAELAKDVLSGLKQQPKTLSAKYFYDDAGSRIFQQIMDLPEYYVTRTEFAILENQKAGICNAFTGSGFFHLVELGSGDGLKTKILLKQLSAQKTDFEYVPVDISGEAMNQLAAGLKKELPGLKTDGFTGDYFKALNWLQKNKPGRKVVLFLGSNIGNFESAESEEFIQKISSYLKPGDKVLMGFDLRKDPNVIRPAYDDAAGVTAAFNLNLLKRLNRELNADFDLDQFEHFADYDPLQGVMKSYLISRKKQTVTFKALNVTVSFEAWEAIHTENSHKYTIPQIEKLGRKSHLEIEEIFTDDKHYFADVLFSVTG